MPFKWILGCTSVGAASPKAMCDTVSSDMVIYTPQHWGSYLGRSFWEKFSLQWVKCHKFEENYPNDTIQQEEDNFFFAGFYYLDNFLQTCDT
jgi:hypothetical protein